MEFFAALFDLSFTNYVTTKLVKAFFVLSIAFAGLMSLVIVVLAFGLGGSSAGMTTMLFIAPVLFVANVIASRVLLETVIVVFRATEELIVLARRPS